MASQPANSTISVIYRLRGQRQINRHDSVKNITHKLRDLVLVKPSQELYTEVKSRATPTDFSGIMGQAYATATRGLPVVIGTKAAAAFSTVETITGIDFPVEIGGDKFVGKVDANLTDDLFNDAQNL